MVLSLKKFRTQPDEDKADYRRQKAENNKTEIDICTDYSRFPAVKQEEKRKVLGKCVIGLPKICGSSIIVAKRAIILRIPVSAFTAETGMR